MQFNQTIPAKELEKLNEAASFINSLFGKLVIVQKLEHTELQWTEEVTVVQITVPNYDVFFALAIQYGRNIEKGNVKEYIKIMFEEMRDLGSFTNRDLEANVRTGNPNDY